MLCLSQRASGKGLPPIELVRIGLKSGFDTSGKNAVSLLSKTCEEAILSTIKKGEQVVVLLNRRGYAPLMYCLDCGKTVTCPNCGIGLAFHKARQKLVCHYCGHAAPHPSRNVAASIFCHWGKARKNLPSSWASLRASLFCAWIATIHVALARSRKFSKILQPRNRLFLLARKCFRRGTIFPM